MSEKKFYNPSQYNNATEIPFWLIRRSEVDALSKLLFGRLTQYCENAGSACVSLEQLCHDLGVHKNQISKSLNNLQTHQLIYIDKSGASRYYYFRVHEWQQAMPLQYPEMTQSQSKQSNVPVCPVQKIIQLYETILPELPRPTYVPDSVRKQIKKRWREAERFQDLEWWSKFFYRVREYDYMMGRLSPSDRFSQPFKADLEWLMRPKNFGKIVNG